VILELRCPACGGEDVRRVSLVHDEGTSHTYTEGTVTPTPMAMLSGAPGWAEDRTIEASSVTQSNLARSLAPPGRPPRWWYVPLGFVVVLLLVAELNSLLHDALGDRVNGWTAPFILAGLFYGWRWVIRRYRKERDLWRETQASWGRSFLCQRCGAVFEAELGGP
jgi:hypothetical protein